MFLAREAAVPVDDKTQPSPVEHLLRRAGIAAGAARKNTSRSITAGPLIAGLRTYADCINLQVENLEVLFPIFLLRPKALINAAIFAVAVRRISE